MSSDTQERLSTQQRRTLLAIARKAVEAEVAGGAGEPEEPNDPVLAQARGAFVTLHVRRQLRGCIGTFHAAKPLYQTVHEMAIQAVHDPRFVYQPLTRAELGQLDIEISVLSPLQRTNDPLSLELGVHGIYVKRGFQAGCFLPQVAAEMNWSKEEFLSYCCSHKAGLAADAWKDPQTEVYLFTAEVFSESSLAGVK